MDERDRHKSSADETNETEQNIEIIAACYLRKDRGVKEMGREENLIPLNKRAKDVQRKIQSKGGFARGEKLRKMKPVKEILCSFASAPLTDEKRIAALKQFRMVDGDITQNALIAWVIITGALKGNPKLLELYLKLTGEDISQRLEITGANGTPLIPDNPYRHLTLEELKKLAGEI